MLESTGRAPKFQPEMKPKNPAAVALGRLGGLKGGRGASGETWTAKEIPDRGQGGEDKVGRA
jgi:hypothetical protein